MVVAAARDHHCCLLLLPSEVLGQSVHNLLVPSDQVSSLELAAAPEPLRHDGLRAKHFIDLHLVVQGFLELLRDLGINFLGDFLQFLAGHHSLEQFVHLLLGDHLLHFLGYFAHLLLGLLYFPFRQVLELHELPPQGLTGPQAPPHSPTQLLLAALYSQYLSSYLIHFFFLLTRSHERPSHLDHFSHYLLACHFQLPIHPDNQLVPMGHNFPLSTLHSLPASPIHSIAHAQDIQPHQLHFISHAVHFLRSPTYLVLLQLNHAYSSQQISQLVTVIELKFVEFFFHSYYFLMVLGQMVAFPLPVLLCL